MFIVNISFRRFNRVYAMYTYWSKYRLQTERDVFSVGL